MGHSLLDYLFIKYLSRISRQNRDVLSYDEKYIRLARLKLLSGISRSIVACVEQTERLVTRIIELLGVAQVIHFNIFLRQSESSLTLASRSSDDTRDRKAPIL